MFQRLSVALQRGNAVSFHSTFTTECGDHCGHFAFTTISCLLALCWRAKNDNNNRRKSEFKALTRIFTFYPWLTTVIMKRS